MYRMDASRGPYEISELRIFVPAEFDPITKNRIDDAEFAMEGQLQHLAITDRISNQTADRFRDAL